MSALPPFRTGSGTLVERYPIDCSSGYLDDWVRESARWYDERDRLYNRDGTPKFQARKQPRARF